MDSEYDSNSADTPRSRDLKETSCNVDAKYKHFMELLKTMNKNEFAPASWLQCAEYPFKWFQCISEQNMYKCDSRKVDDYSNQGECYSFEKYTYLLVLLFQSVLMKDNEDTKNYLHQLKELLKNMACDETNRMYAKIIHAFEHVVVATEAQLMVLENFQMEEQISKDVMKMLKPLSEMTPEQKAGVEAIKAMFYLHCSTETKLAVDHMMKAAKLDPEFAAWQYWLGKVLRKLRREDKNKKKNEDELYYFKSAVSKDWNPKHLLYLAQAYREKAYDLYITHNSVPDGATSNSNEEIDSLNNLSYTLYRECWSLKQDSAAICRRLGNGLMNLPCSLTDYELAKHVLHKALDLSQNPITFHILGTYYFRYEQNHEEAIKYFKKSADNGMMYGYNEVIRLKMLNDPEYDPLEDLKLELEAMKYSVKLDLVYCDIGWYYLCFKNDLIKALEYFWNVIEENEESIYLMRFRSFSLCVYERFNIYPLLKNEAENFLKENGENTPENLAIVYKFLKKINNRSDLLASEIYETLLSVKNKIKKNLGKL